MCTRLPRRILHVHQHWIRVEFSDGRMVRNEVRFPVEGPSSCTITARGRGGAKKLNCWDLKLNILYPYLEQLTTE
jgi:hypothetical protein